MDQTTPLRVGLVGLGGVAQAHMRACASSERIKLCAGADIDAEKAHEAARRFNFTPYTNYERMIAEQNLDIVCVLTPPSLHRPVAETAAQAGAHILCEKPLAPSMADAEAMHDTVQRAGVQFMFGASYRHLPAMKEAKRMMADGEIGDIRICMEVSVGGVGEENARVLSEIHYPTGGPGGSPMGLVDHGIHLIDAIPWLTGSPITSVFGVGNVAGERLKPEFASLQLHNGAVGFLIYDEASVSLVAPSEGIFSAGPGWSLLGPVTAGSWDQQPCVISIYGAEGALRIYPYANTLYHATPQEVRQKPLPPLPTPNNFRTQIESFADTIQFGSPLAAGIDDGVNSLRALMAVYESKGERAVILR